MYYPWACTDAPSYFSASFAPIMMVKHVVFFSCVERICDQTGVVYSTAIQPLQNCNSLFIPQQFVYCLIGFTKPMPFLTIYLNIKNELEQLS